MKVLASTVSLLCFSQASMADIISTTTLNGLTHTFTFATQAEAQAAATNPTDAQIAFFVNGTQIPDRNGIGAVTRSFDTTKPNDPPVVMIKTAKTEIVVQKTLANGTVDASVIKTGTVTAFNTAVEAFLTDPATVDPTAITSATASSTAFDLVQDATVKASADIAKSKPSTLADTAAQAAQVTSINSISTGLNATLATTPFISTTAILGGKAVTYVYADAAAAQAAANNPNQYAADFPGVTSVIGLVTQNTTGGKTATIIKTGFGTAVVAIPQADGTTVYTQVTSTTFKGLNAAVDKFITTGVGGTTLQAGDPALKAAQGYLATAKTTLAAAVKAGTVPASTLAALNNTLNDIPGVIPPAPAKNAAIVAAAASARNTLAAEQSKVFSALGTTGTQQVTAAAAALDAQLAAVQAVGQKTVAQQASIDAAALNYVNQLAAIKTNEFQAQNNISSGVAGNPTSTMNMTVDSMFNQAADFGGDNKTNIASSSSDSGVTTSVGVGVQYGYYDLGGKSSNTVSLPLSVTAKFNPKHQLTLSVPLSYIATQNQSDAYQVGVGLAYKYNVTDNWSLTPAMSYAYRSFDNSQNQYWNPSNNTSVVGGSISSKYTWNFSPMSVSLINMIGHYQSLDSNNATSNLNLTGFGNYVGNATGNSIANYVVKNGLHATKMFGNFKVGAYFTDTHYFGSALYFDQFNEFGLSLKPQNAGKMLDALTVDANYLFSLSGPHSNQLDGFRLNLGYKF